MSNKLVLNPLTGKLDFIAVRNSLDTDSRVYLGTDTYLSFDGINTVTLVINGITVQTWSASSTHSAGEPAGLLLALTYPTSG